MKKQGLLSFILALVGAMWIATAGAQTKYNLKIAGVEVTSANCNDLTVIPGVKGKVKYNDATKTLTLENAIIHATAEDNYDGDGSGIYNYNDADSLTIRLVGNNLITSKKGAGILNEELCTIILTGGGKLVVKGSTTASEDHCQTGIFNRELIIVRNCTLVVTGGERGIDCGLWTFDHCTMCIKGDNKSNDPNKGSMGWIWFDKPEFIGCAITSPKGVYWKQIESNYEPVFLLFGANGKVVTDWVIISPTHANPNLPVRK